MQDILKWLAGLSGEELAPNESLRFEFLSLPRGGLGLVLVLLFAATLAGVFLIYRRDATRLSRGRRGFLATLRVLALVCVAVVLLEPNLVKVRRVTKPGEVILMLDASQSMGHRDSYARSPSNAASWRALGVADPSEHSRLDLAKKLLSQEGLVAGLGARNRLRPYLFGSGLRAFPEKAPTGTAPPAPVPGELPPPPELDVASVDAREGSTNLSASVRRALEASQKTRIAALVVVSDGRRNAGGSPEEVGGLLELRTVDKVLVVGVGDPAETWSLSVREVRAAERVFKGDPLKVSATVTSQGYGEQSVGVRLEIVDAAGDTQKLLASTRVVVGGERASADVTFPAVRLEQEGDHILRVAVEPPGSETFDVERHARDHRVKVLGEKLRCLIISGGPTHEYRTLRVQLMRDKTIDVACWLQSASRDFPQDGNIVLEELPIKPEEVDSFDVVILMDPDPNPVTLSPVFVGELAKAVTERGTGLWWVAGDKYSLKAMEPGSPLLPLAKLLPVEGDQADPRREVTWGGYFKKSWRWDLTTAGKEHRICRLLPDPVVNATLWQRLPGHYWSFPVLRAKPAAQVLLRHENKQVRAIGGNRPLVAVQFVGSGRVLFSATDETYRWRSIAREAYNRFWIKGLRYLYEGKLTGGTSRFRLGLSTEQVTLGQEVDIFLRALDERFEPLSSAEIAVRLEGPDGIARELRLEPAAGGDGRFEGSFRPTRIGSYKVSAPEGVDENEFFPIGFEVLRSELESRGPMGIAELTRLADSAGGEVVAPSDLLARVSEIASRSRTETFFLPHPLWDNWFALGLVVLLLALEWYFRKRFDLM